MENNTRAQMPMPFMEPQLNDIVSVIETRNIHFAKAFSRDYCLEIIDLLKKVESYDRLMNFKGEELYIRITICSEGGSILALFSLLEQIEHMKEIGYTVHTHSNFAASCGFILHCSGNYKTCSEFAVLLNHQGSSMTRGTVMEMRTDLRFTEMLENKINDYLRKNTRMSEEEIQRPARTNLDIWYSADEAMAIGVVDEIINL